MNALWCSNRTHHGIVLDTSSKGFDKGAVTFGSVFLDEDDPKNLFLFYTGAKDISWSHSAIGLATSSDFVRFRKVGSDPVLEGTEGSFCCREALTPAVTKLGNRFYMVFSGRPSVDSFRRLGLAWADDPVGPWNIIAELKKSFYMWENGHIENGPSLVKLDNETVLVFYSNTSSAGLNVVNFLKQLVVRREFCPAWLDVPTFLRRYLIRRIAPLKLKITGPSKASIEVHRFSGNVLKHLNGPKGSWNESLFCPGYFQLRDTHYLVPATSLYSERSLNKRYIGIVSCNSPYFNETEYKIQKLIDGPSEKSAIMPNIKGEILLDSPSPLLSDDSKVLYLYYSVMGHTDNIWKTALTTFKLERVET